MREGAIAMYLPKTPAAMDRVMGYSWPGNVRELKSALEYAFVIAEKGLIEPDHLPLLQDTRKAMGVSTNGWGEPAGTAEKEALVRALRQSNGNHSEAARVLGINRVTVRNRKKKYGIDLKRVLVSDPGSG